MRFLRKKLVKDWTKSTTKSKELSNISPCVLVDTVLKLNYYDALKQKKDASKDIHSFINKLKLSKKDKLKISKLLNMLNTSEENIEEILVFLLTCVTKAENEIEFGYLIFGNKFISELAQAMFQSSLDVFCKDIVLKHSFLEFLRSRKSPENFACYIKVQECIDQKSVTNFYEILSEFIETGSSQEVNISDKTRQILQSPNNTSLKQKYTALKVLQKELKSLIEMDVLKDFRTSNKCGYFLKQSLIRLDSEDELKLRHFKRWARKSNAASQTFGELYKTSLKLHSTCVKTVKMAKKQTKNTSFLELLATSSAEKQCFQVATY